MDRFSKVYVPSYKAVHVEGAEDCGLVLFDEAVQACLQLLLHCQKRFPGKGQTMETSCLILRVPRYLPVPTHTTLHFSQHTYFLMHLWLLPVHCGGWRGLASLRRSSGAHRPRHVHARLHWPRCGCCFVRISSLLSAVIFSGSASCSICKLQ